MINIPEIPQDLFPIACGCMKLGGKWTADPLEVNAQRAARAAVEAALEAGINVFDHADIYARGKSEETFKTIFNEQPSLREKVVIQTKCGIRFPGEPRQESPGRYDFSFGHIMRSVEGSLDRLGTSYVDVLFLHRPDPLVEPQEVARAFEELHTSGKVRAFGVSNHTPAQMELLALSLNPPIRVSQVQFSLLHTDLIDGGLTGRSPRPVSAAGTIEYCRRHGILLQAWGPLAGGMLGGSKSSKKDDPDCVKAVRAQLADIAAEKGSLPEIIALAWILRHPAKIQPVIGSRRPRRIQALCRATEIDLTREEWYRLFIAGRGEHVP